MGAVVPLNKLADFDKTKALAAPGFRFVFGVDEAGRGPLAGPVVAAAVWVRDPGFTRRIGDSKLLSARQREAAFYEIFDRSVVGLGLISEQIIDTVNILNATHLAMTAALRDLVWRLPVRTEQSFSAGTGIKVLVDGNSYKGTWTGPVETVVKGDACSLSIACASIVAKVYRDRMMDMYDRLYPGYELARHKGYPTPAHRQAIRRLGLSPIHRRSFSCD